MLAEIIAIILITLVFSFLFFYGFGRRGPWGSFWAFLLILFLSLFLFEFWITPIGPIWWGVAWIDLLIIGLIFALLLAAASPPRSSLKKRETPQKMARDEGAIVIGAFFWILVLIIIVAIATIIFYRAAV